MKIYDYLIIGGGTAGLFTALLLREKYPTAKILLLEKSNYLGGRVKFVKIGGKKVNLGADVAEFYKDFILQDLLSRYNIPIQPFTYRINFKFEPLDVVPYIEDMKTRHLDLNKNFKDNFIRLYGKDVYKRFTQTVGETDYEKMDVIDALYDYADVLYDYGFDFYVDGVEEFYPDWEPLLKNLISELKERKIILKRNTNVEKVIKTNQGFEVETEKRDFLARNVIYATTLPGLSTYFDKGFQKLIKQIRCQPFLKYYIQSDRPINSIQGYTYFGDYLQKSNDLGDNVYLIAYNDNKFANQINKLGEDQLKEKIEKRFGVKILKAIKHYWGCGTHYYLPLKKFKNRDEFIDKVQNYDEGLYVVGELISRRQGYVEGALESVVKIIDKI